MDHTNHPKEEYVLRTLSPPMRLLYLSLAMLLSFLLLAPDALAVETVPPDAHTLVLPQTQLIAAVLGALVPALAYVINHYAPWVSEPAKAIFLALLAAAVGALTELFDAGGIPLDWNTAQIVGTAVVLAFLSHTGFWKPSGLSSRLKAGTNKPGQPPPA